MFELQNARVRLGRRPQISVRLFRQVTPAAGGMVPTCGAGASVVAREIVFSRCWGLTLTDISCQHFIVMTDDSRTYRCSCLVA